MTIADLSNQGVEFATRVERFLVEECALLDERLFRRWLDLFRPDAIYWIPCNSADVDPMSHVSLIYDDVSRLKERIDRIESGWAHAQDPPSRTSRIIGNLRLRNDGEVHVVDANFLVTEVRRSQQRVHAGRYTFRLVERDDELHILQKKVDLLSNDTPIDNLTLLL